MSWDYILYLLAIIVMFISIGIQTNVTSTFNKYSKLGSKISGYDAARMILDNNGLFNVGIERVAGALSDHYDPKANVIRLSDSVYDKCTAAAVGVAAHEAGHAVQYATGYAPIKFRTAIVPVCNFGAKFAIPLVLIGFLLNSYILALVGVIGYGLLALFQFVTLPVEFNASARAVSALNNSGMLSNEEISAAKKVLTAAALTYVAAFASSAIQFARLLLMVSRKKDR